MVKVLFSQASLIHDDIRAVILTNSTILSKDIVGQAALFDSKSRNLSSISVVISLKDVSETIAASSLTAENLPAMEKEPLGRC